MPLHRVGSSGKDGRVPSRPLVVKSGLGSVLLIFVLAAELLRKLLGLARVHF